MEAQMTSSYVALRAQRSSSEQREERNATVLLGIILGLTLIGVAAMVTVADAFLPFEGQDPTALEQMLTYQ
jgi:hypothetical protein